MSGTTPLGSADSPVESTEEQGESESQHNADERFNQAMVMVEAALEVAGFAQNSPGKSVIIHKREAEYLLTIPRDILRDISSLAIRRVQHRRGDDYLSLNDIDWAISRVLVGKRNNASLTILNTVGGLLLGAGLPLFIGPLASGTEMGTGSALLAAGLCVTGVLALSVAMTLSFFRR